MCHKFACGKIARGKIACEMSAHQIAKKPKIVKNSVQKLWRNEKTIKKGSASALPQRPEFTQYYQLFYTSLVYENADSVRPKARSREAGIARDNRRRGGF